MSGINDGQTYSCDCTATGYYGKNCETAFWYTWIHDLFKPSKGLAHQIMTDWKFKPLIWVINHVEWISDTLTAQIYVERADFLDSYGRYDSLHDYINFDARTNGTLHGRILPPVPENCPTPLGVVGPKELPPVESVLALFKRKKFKPNPLKTNCLFPFYAQFFTHQFFRTDQVHGPEYTKVWSHGVDLTQLYGNDLERQRKLRTLKDGKMKVQVINGEEWPPSVKDADVVMDNPLNLNKEKLFALGHPFFSIMPGLLMYSTVWIREHNRVASILKSTHPAWDDERLFQTTRLILLGEMIKITIQDYVQHLSNYNLKLKHKPEVLFGKPFQYQNKISVEFNLMYRWHALIPDNFTIGGSNYPLENFYGNNDIVTKRGLNTFVDGLMNTRAGQITHGNHHPMVLNVVKTIIKYGRRLKFQSFNNYRRYFDLEPYKTFEDLVGDDEPELAAELKRLYGGDVEAMELVPGFYLEKRISEGMFGEMIVELGAPASLTGLMSNAINSPKYWKPSTFGGDVGFDIVKTASIGNLFCKNMKNEKPCPDIVFEVPEGSQSTRKEL